MRVLGSSLATFCLELQLSNMHSETVVTESSLWAPGWPWEGHCPSPCIGGTALLTLFLKTNFLGNLKIIYSGKMCFFLHATILIDFIGNLCTEKNYIEQ